MLHDDDDPDHHLWRNGRLYWVAFTVHLPGWQKERVRRSLGTADVAEARRRRDVRLHQGEQVRPAGQKLYQIALANAENGTQSRTYETPVPLGTAERPLPAAER